MKLKGISRKVLFVTIGLSKYIRLLEKVPK
jgi:hypothetical protein